MTQGGVITVLYAFCSQANCADGEYPGGLMLGSDGNFYGGTSYGGSSGLGTIFRVTRTGKLTTLHSFDGTDGQSSAGMLMQATNGVLYGAAYYGGSGQTCTYGCGTIFSLSNRLDPFVKTLPGSGKVGAMVVIMGNNLNGTTRVSFGGAATTFTIVSSTELKAVVPEGAITGFVQVTAPNRVLKSNVKFRVIP